jgi:hypothetical protein
VAGNSVTNKALEPAAVIAAAPSAQVDKLPAFTVISDEYMAPFKRTVEVRLPARISNAELSAIAEVIKARATGATDRTFIGYRIAGELDPAYWATTHYNPVLEVKVFDDF